MAESPLRARADSGATTVKGPSTKQQMYTAHGSSSSTSNNQDDEHDATDDEHDDNNNTSNNGAPVVPIRAKRPSYRILGTHTSLQLEHEHDSTANNSSNNNDDEDNDDPMAWADLEAFGGTRKTLAKKAPLRKLTPDEVREQLDELADIEQHMQDAAREQHSKQSMLDTIAWLQRHNDAIEAAGVNQKLKRSSSFVRSVLSFFSSSSGNSSNNSRRRGTSSSDADSSNVVDHSNNKAPPHQHAHPSSNTSSSVFDEEYEHFPKLHAPWGQRELACDWSHLGFALLNQTVRHDIERVRTVLTSGGGLGSATPQAIVAVAKWLTLFDQHVHDVMTLKEYLLEERAVIAGVGYKVTTLYDAYTEALAAALARVHDDRRYLGDAIEHMFSELETILDDEAAAVAHVVATSLTEAQEYDALSCLFHHLSDDDSCGVIVAKLLGWMKLHFAGRDVQAFLATVDRDVHDRLAGEWMRQFASYLHLLDTFALHSETSMAFFT